MIILDLRTCHKCVFCLGVSYGYAVRDQSENRGAKSLKFIINLSQNVIHADEDAGQGDPRRERGWRTVPADGDAAIGIHPGVQSLDLPAPLISSFGEAPGGDVLGGACDLSTRGGAVVAVNLGHDCDNVKYQ